MLPQAELSKGEREYCKKKKKKRNEINKQKPRTH